MAWLDAFSFNQANPKNYENNGFYCFDVWHFFLVFKR